MKTYINYTLCIFSFVVLFFYSSNVFARVDLNERYQKIQEDIQKNPDDLNRRMDLAYLFTQGLEFGRAVEIYQKVMQQEPTNKRAANELCVLFTQMRNVNKAGQYCQQAVSLSPGNYLVHDNLGLSYFKLGEYTKSLKPFLQALALEERSILVKYHIAEAFLALNEFELARLFLEKLSRSANINKQEEALVYHGLYLTYTKLKDYKLALASINQTYRISGNSLFLGKIMTAFIKANQIWIFMIVSLVLLWLCHYFGQRLNRFLKNE